MLKDNIISDSGGAAVHTQRPEAADTVRRDHEAALSLPQGGYMIIDALNTTANGDWTGFTSLISTVGFPIVCCLIMFYQNNKLQETLKEFSTTLQKFADELQHIENILNIKGAADGSK